MSAVFQSIFVCFIKIKTHSLTRPTRARYSTVSAKFQRRYRCTQFNSFCLQFDDWMLLKEQRKFADFNLTLG